MRQSHPDLEEALSEGRRENLHVNSSARLLIGCTAIASAVVLYAISFFLPAIKLNVRTQPGFPEPIRPGHVAFVQGLFGLIVRTPAEFVWIANPAFWVAIGTAIFGRWRMRAFLPWPRWRVRAHSTIDL